MESYVLSAQIVAAGLILMSSVIGSSVGMAILGGSFLGSVARQPEMSSVLTSRFFMLVGLVDAMPFIGLAMAIGFYNPFAG